MFSNKNKKTQLALDNINKNLEQINTSIYHISEQQRRNDNSYRNEILYKTHQNIEGINKSNKIISAETIKPTYTAGYNLTYIIYTHSLFFGSIVGIMILYYYLKNIGSIQLLSDSISSINILLFFAIFLIINIMIYAISIIPIQLTIEYNIEKEEWIYTLPSLTTFVCIIVFEFALWSNIECIINNPVVTIMVIASLLIIGSLYLLICKNKDLKDICIYKTFYLNLIFYYIIASFFSTLFVLFYNKGEHDFFFYAYAILIPILVFINILFNQELRKGKENQINQSILFSFITTTIGIISIAFSPVILPIETNSFNRIMQIIGQQDKDDKIYYIEGNFLKTNLEPPSLVIEIENHRTKNISNENIKNANNEDIEHNKYIAHCGKIYLDTGDKTVFKIWNSDNFLQIPTNKIFEYQGRTLTCDVIKVRDNPIQVISLIQHKNH